MADGDAPDLSLIPEPLWQEAERRAAVLRPLANLPACPRDQARTAAAALGVTERQVYRLLASPQGLFARQRFLGHKRNMGYATRFNRAIGSLSGWNSPAGSRLACSQR